MLLNADLSRSLNVLKEKNKSRLIGVSKVAWGVGGGMCGSEGSRKSNRKIALLWLLQQDEPRTSLEIKQVNLRPYQRRNQS